MGTERHFSIKKLFWPANGVRSTQSLVEIHNTCFLLKVGQTFFLRYWHRVALIFIICIYNLQSLQICRIILGETFWKVQGLFCKLNKLWTVLLVLVLGGWGQGDGLNAVTKPVFHRKKYFKMNWIVMLCPGKNGGRNRKMKENIFWAHSYHFRQRNM